MPRTKNASRRGSPSHRYDQNEDFDAFNFVSREAQDKYLLGRPVQPCRNIHSLNFDCYELLDKLTQVG